MVECEECHSLYMGTTVCYSLLLSLAASALDSTYFKSELKDVLNGTYCFYLIPPSLRYNTELRVRLKLDRI